MSVRHNADKERGQALVEFALILPILLIVVIGIFDFGRLVTAYSLTSTGLRDAARYATVVGQVGGTPRYLSCASMEDAIQNVLLPNPTITITYRKASNTATTFDCDTVTDAALENGDILEFTVDYDIPLITPFISSVWPSIPLEFEAQRTIFKTLRVGTSDLSLDSEPDGLADAWEALYFDPIDPDLKTTQTATDDYDNDGCNNGCEEIRGTDPTNPDTDGDGLSDGDEIFLYGTNPLSRDTDGDGVDDDVEIANGTDPRTPGATAGADAATTPFNTAVTIDVMANDLPGGPGPLNITSYDGASAAGGTVTIVDPMGTPADPSDDQLRYTPPADYEGDDTFTYTITDVSNGSTATATVIVTVESRFGGAATPVPSPVPPDISHSAPFTDLIVDTRPHWWRLDAGAVFTGWEDWDVDWWRWTSVTGDPAVDAAAAMANTPECSTVQPYSVPINFYWEDSGPTPGSGCTGTPWASDNFAVRWLKTFGIENDVVVRLRTVANDGIRVYYDGVEIAGLSGWNVSGSNTTRTVENFVITGGEVHTFLIEYFEYQGAATAAFLIDNGTNDDTGVCNWQMSSEAPAYSGSFFWNDSPGDLYANSSQCHIALRGAVNLATLSQPPQMSFMDIWNLNDAGDVATLQIRRYGTIDAWATEVVHVGPDNEPMWTEQSFDLSSFGGDDFTGANIEFRFVLEADSAGPQDGWWIDDVEIDDGQPHTYTIGFSDTMEFGNTDWAPSGSWAISSEHTRNGSTGAWSDSPTSLYAPSTDSTLQLDGIVDLSDPASTDPELVFYHSWNLGAGDSIFVETAASSTGPWAPLTGAELEIGTTNMGFVREVIPLVDGSTFYLRFRIETDGTDEGDGWWIDDISLQNHVSTLMPYPFTDGMEAGSSNWIAEGAWAISPEQKHAGASSWSDSPGTLYADNSNTSVQSAMSFLIPGTAVNPELSFWHRRSLSASDNFYAEVSTDDGSTWTSLWSYEYSASTTASPEAPGAPGVSGVPLLEFNTQLAWEYVSVDMSGYVGTEFDLRFRLDSRADGVVGDGIWIDDIRLGNSDATPAHTLPFTDGMEGTTNWRYGGTWGVTAETAHGGSYSLTDSPAGAYAPETWSVLQLIRPLDLTGATFPYLSWWERYAIRQYDYARVQVSAWNGSTWGTWTEVAQHYFDTSLSWNYNYADLRPFVGQQIRLRFVLDALQDGGVNEGWWIDDVQVAEYNPEIIAHASFDENANDLGRWILDGNWGTEAITSSVGSGPAAFGGGNWTAAFYDLTEHPTHCIPPEGFATAADIAVVAIEGTAFNTQYPNCLSQSRIFTPDPASISEINFICTGSNTPNPNGTCSTASWPVNGNVYGAPVQIAASFSRTFDVPVAGYYDFSVTHNDGVRLYVDSVLQLDQWVNSATAETHEVSVNMTTGSHTIEVWYYYDTLGDAVFALDLARPDASFHDSPGSDYLEQSNPALTLGSVVDLNGVTTPTLHWDDRFDVLAPECMVVEVSLPYVSMGEWESVYSDCAGGSTTWASQSVPILTALQNLGATTFTGSDRYMAVRFRMDGRTNDGSVLLGDGWWVDNVTITP